VAAQPLSNSTQKLKANNKDFVFMADCAEAQS
jgi:hypothetical protein